MNNTEEFMTLVEPGSPRIIRLKECVLTAPYGICLERKAFNSRVQAKQGMHTSIKKLLP